MYWGEARRPFRGPRGRRCVETCLRFFRRELGWEKGARGMRVSKFWAGSRSFVVRRVCSEGELCHKAVTCRPGFLVSTSGLPTSCFWPSQHVMCLADAWAPG
jgi:hypothetical protein